MYFMHSECINHRKLILYLNSEECFISNLSGVDQFNQNDFVFTTRFVISVGIPFNFFNN